MRRGDGITGEDRDSRRGRVADRRVALLGCWGLLIYWLTAACALGSAKGLPLTRFYPYEEIDNISRGARLTFDAFGRIAAVQEGALVVLNDSSWQDLMDPNERSIEVREATVDRDGLSYYYGALGSWGALVPAPGGKLRPEPFVPDDYPKWVRATNFDDILCAPEGIYFSGWNGIVFWNRATRTHRFFEISSVARVFAFAGKVYVSSHERGLLVLDALGGTVAEADRSAFGNPVVARSASAGPACMLLATSARQLLVMREGGIEPLAGPMGTPRPGPVAAMESLPEGDVALAITNGGVYIVDAAGEVKLALTGSQFSRVTALASHEPGVLWAAMETGIIKILYGHPVTTFGLALGLAIEWPQVVAWNHQTIVASGGRLYEPVDPEDRGPTQFRPVPSQPAIGAWGITALGSSLLIANGTGVFVREPGAGFEVAVPNLDSARLVALDDATCFVLASAHIAVVRRQNGVWSECAPRIPGLGYPSIVHRGKNTAWIELGVNRVARVTLREGRLESRLFETFPWARPGWVNLSVVGSTVVFVSANNAPLFFDDELETFVDRPELREVFEQSPYPLVRIHRDEAGTFWGSHQHGVVALTRQGDGYIADATSYSFISERIPLIRTLPSGEIWASTGQSLYHIDRASPGAAAPRFRPVLVAIRDNRTTAELVRGDQTERALRPLAYRENSVTFDFFSGSYASLRSPEYEYRRNEGAWTKVASGSSISLSDLNTGSHRLEVRLVDRRGPVGTTRTFAFAVRPPWYGTWWALGIYPLLATLLMHGLIRLFLRRAEARSAALEQVVAARTRELQATMYQLQQETRTSATLAERNRLAGEIHDSLEQGFAGLTLQLETTAAFGNCTPEVKTGLAVALNMVAFSRNEVRHAVRDLHSPILDSADLESALRQIIAQSAPAPGYAVLQCAGRPRRLNSSVEHHLLRIAQEAIANSVKHASASQLTVQLTFRDTEVQLDIRDDGRGFDPEAILNRGFGHFGLPSFRGRASKIGGTVTIESRPGHGTLISVHVPLGEPSFSSHADR